MVKAMIIMGEGHGDNVSGKRIAASLLMLMIIAASFPDKVAAAIITEAKIKTAIVNYVESNMQWSPGTFRVEGKSKLNDVVIPGEDITLEITARPDQDFVGDTAFRVKYYSGAKLVKETSLRVGMEALREVVVSTKTLKKDKVITAEDVRVTKKWVRRLSDRKATASGEVIGKVLTVNIRQNNEIARNIIKEPRLIKAGGPVRIMLDNGNFSIRTMGISQENGIAEALIRVKNASSKKIIYARVVGESLVKVEF